MDSEARWSEIVDQPPSASKPDYYRSFGPIAACKSAVRRRLGQANELRESASQVEAEAAFIKGLERHSAEPITTFYFGHKKNLAYLLDRVFAEYEIEILACDLKVWQARRWLRAWQSKADIQFAELPRPFNKMLGLRGFVEVPDWIQQRLDLADSWEAVLQRFRKNTKTTELRKIRKFNIGCRITSTEEEANAFYEDMYIPYLDKRFGELAEYEPHSRITFFATEGCMLQVTRDDRVNGAVVLFEQGKTLLFLWIGVRDDIQGNEFQGLFSALYYYTIRYAYQMGYDSVDLSGTRPLLNDGVFLFKRKWGAAAYDNWSHDRIMLRPNQFTPGVASFLANNSWVVRVGRKLVGKIVFDQKILDEEGVEMLCKRYLSPGIGRLQVFATRGVEAQAIQSAQHHWPDVEIIDLSQAPDPAARFTR